MKKCILSVCFLISGIALSAQSKCYADAFFCKDLTLGYVCLNAGATTSLSCACGTADLCPEDGNGGNQE